MARMKRAPKVLPKKDDAGAKEAPKVLPKKQGWGTVLYVLGMLIWVAASVISVQLAVGYLMVWILGVDTFTKPVWTAVYSALSYVLALAMVIFIPPLVVKAREQRKAKNPVRMGLPSRTALGLRGWPTWTDIGLAPAGFIVSLLLAAGLVALFSLFPWFDAEQAQDVGFSTFVVGFDRIVAFLTLVVVAPIAEEIIFRGWLYGKLREKLSQQVSDKISVAISVFLVSLLFGIVHLQWNVGVNVFAMSIVLCALREITGTIYAGILMHMLKNGVAFYLLYVLGI